MNFSSALSANTTLQGMHSGVLLQKQSQSASSSTQKVPEKVKEAAQQFEAVFLGEMFSHMFEGTEVDPMFGGGQGEKMFRSMLIQEYGKEMAKGPGIGISTQLQQMMLKMQEAQHGKLPTVNATAATDTAETAATEITTPETETAETTTP